MGPGMGIGSGSVGSAADMSGLIAGLARNTGGEGTGSGNVVVSGQSSLSISATMIQSSVSTMLSTLGGGLGDDRLLRMMIALMILMAMLEKGRGFDDSSERLMASLGRLNSQSGSIGLGIVAGGSSFQSISVEQTSELLITYHESSGSTPPQAGSSLDLAG